jgi:triacylglycerol lipase
MRCKAVPTRLARALQGWLWCLCAAPVLMMAAAKPSAAAMDAPVSAVHVRRDVSYGPSPEQRLDLFAPSDTPAGTAGGLRPILVFAPPEAARSRHYDNVALWAAHHQMIGVVMHRRDNGTPPWERGPQDFAAMLAWMQANGRAQGGDPQRVIVMGADLGGTQLMNYLTHHQYWCCGGPAVAAVALIGSAVNLTSAMTQSRQPAPGVGGAAQTLTDPTRSDLTGLDSLYVPLFVGSPLHPTDAQRRTAVQLQQELCRRGRCPTLRFLGERDVTAVLRSFDTPNEEASRQLLAWIQSLH